MSPRRRAVTFLALAVCVLATTVAPVPVSAGVDVVRTPGEADYEFRLRAGASGRTWRGSGEVAFTNVGTGSLPEIYLRVWSNGVLGCGDRSIVVSHLQGGDITDERLDCTELEVTLDDPLGPGERTSLAFDLRIELPTENDRFGLYQGLALAGTALPILAVHDDRGWHREPFENLGESFYSIVADYEVTFLTPRGLDTAATGVVSDRTQTGHGRVRTTYRASSVRDFAWAAGRFRTVRREAGRVGVLVSYQPARVSRVTAQRVAADGAGVVRALGEAFGRYPYPQVDVVLTGPDGFGGMEYPTIVFSDERRSTIAHELAHQWFFGIVGNDAYREPWLDESFATWAGRLPFTPRVGCSGIPWPSPDAELTHDMGYWSAHPSRYGLVYTGGACLLANLAKRFGLERFVRIVGRYVERHRLGIARTEDFMAAIERAADTHLDGFDADAYWQRWRVSPG